MPVPPNSTPEQIIAWMAECVVRRFCDDKSVPNVVMQVAEATAAAVLRAPTKTFPVKRVTPQGMVVQHVTLPEAITELSDLMKVDIELKREMIKALNSNTKACRKILAQSAEADED